MLRSRPVQSSQLTLPPPPQRLLILGSYGLRVRVDNPEQILMPGMYVRAVVGSGVRESGLLVPMQGIAREPKGDTSAMVVGEDGTVQVRPVKVSRAIGWPWKLSSRSTTAAFDSRGS